MENSSTCPYGFDVVESLKGKNVTPADEIAWPCELRIFWIELLPFVTFVRGLLSYGTSIIVIFGVVLNSLSLFVLTRKQMRKSTTNMYLSVLAVYDILSLTMNFMIGVMRGQNVDINASFQRSEDLCKFHGVIVELFNLLSVWIIVSFTIERFIMIKFPLRAKSLTQRRAFFVITGVSAAVFLFSMHKIAVSGFEGDSVFGYKACKTRRAIFPEVIYFYVAFNTWLPTVIIVTLNSLIIREIWINKKKREQMTATSMSKSDEKATKLLLAVSTTYVVLILPLGLIQTTELIWNGTAKVAAGNEGYVEFQMTKMKLKWARAFFFFFYQFNFAVNFFLYVFSSSASRFRTTLRSLLGMKVSPEEFTQATIKTNAVAPARQMPIGKPDDKKGKDKAVPDDS